MYPNDIYGHKQSLAHNQNQDTGIKAQSVVQIVIDTLPVGIGPYLKASFHGFPFYLFREP